MTTIFENLFKSLLPGKIIAVQVGFSRTAVLAETDQGIRCGLAATLSNPGFEHRRQPAVRNAGHLHEMSVTDLVGLFDSPSFTEASIGLAAINALLPGDPGQCVDLKAEDYLTRNGVNKNVAVVGHFPFLNELKPLARNLWVLELNPGEGDLPAQVAPEIIPQADLVAVTATTLINKTFQNLISLCRPDAHVVLIGPSTPLTPVLYECGIDAIFGTVVTNPYAALLGISQGMSIHQLRQAGSVRFVAMKNGRDL